MQWNQCNEAGDKTVRDLTSMLILGEDNINCSISLTDTRLNDENEGGDLSGRDNRFK